MGIALLKKLNTHMPDFVKRMGGSIIRKKLVENREFLDTYKTLDEYSSWNSVDRENIQFEKLKECLTYAYLHVPYYHSLFDDVGFVPEQMHSLDDTRVIPILTKKMIVDNFEQLQSDDITDYYSATTGGSTGTPLKVNLERNSIYRERAFIYHFWNQAGYDYNVHRLATFRGTDFNGKLFKYNPLYNEIQLNPCNINSETILAYYNSILKFKADYIQGFPGAIYSFCRFAKELDLNVAARFKAVFFISENVYDFQRDYIEKVLKCKTYAFYGHTERAVFAEQKCGGYCFNQLYGYTEIDTQDNSIICTGFLNKKMPLIRYKLDDYAECIGERSEKIYRIEGHRKGGLIGKNNECISSAMLEIHSAILERIAQYQFVQDKKGEVTVLLVPVDEISADECETVQGLYQAKVGNALKVTVKRVDSVIFTQRGKYQLIIQNVKN